MPFALVMLQSLVAYGSPIFDEIPSTSPKVQAERWWMGGTELVLVVESPINAAPSPDVLYAGPMGGLAQIVTQRTVVVDAIMGDVHSGAIEVWHLEGAAGTPNDGIIFAHRWRMEDITGSMVSVVAGEVPVYASDAVGMVSTLRVLRFADDRVLNFADHAVCRGDGGEALFLVECAEGATADRPEDIIAYLKDTLAGREGAVLPGAPYPFQP